MIFSQPLIAQDKFLPVFHFNKLTTADGLPTNELRSNIVRDRQGFVWIPTLNGLARYDGYTCRNYRNQPGDSTSISSNLLFSIYLDKRNRLWIGSWDAGISVFDPVRDKFINIYPRKNDSNWLTFRTILFIREDKQGNVWVMGTDGEVESINMSELVNYEDPDSLYTHIRFSDYNSLTRTNKTWDIESWGKRSIILSSVEGFFTIDPVTQQISRPELVATDGFRLDTIQNVTLFRESEFILWMGTHHHHLFRYDERKGSLKHYPPKTRDGQKLYDNIQYMGMDGFGYLWIGTNSGFEVFDTSTGMFFDYLFSSPDGPKHEGTETKKMTLDNTGTFWVAGGNSGLCYMPGRSRLFQHYGLRDTARKALEMGSIARWDDGSFWIGASGKTVNINPMNLRIYRIIDFLKGAKPSYFYTGENDVYTDGKSTIWYGTWNLGLYMIEPLYGRVTNYRVSDQIPSRINNICWKIEKGAGDTLWIAGELDGLLFFNTRTGKYSIPKDSVLSRLRNIYHVMRDGSGSMWISDERSGLFRGTLSGDMIEHFEYDRNDPTSISFAKVQDTYQDANGKIWIGGDGIDCWESGNKTFKHYPNRLFDMINDVEPLGSDSRGRLWVRTRGIGLHLLDPATGKYINFDRSDGLLDNVMMMSQLTDGRMILTGGNGINIVHPDSLSLEYSPPPIVLSRVTVNDTMDFSYQVMGGKKDLELDYYQNSIEFEFAAIDPGVTYMIRYYYQLEGFEETWIDPKNRRYVRYPRLNFGDYVFKVKAVNTWGRWPDQEISLVISIAPPWWRTWWAYTVYGFLFVGLLFGGYRLRLRQIYLKQHADMEHFQAERLAEVDKLKSRFFANISHEFRTPLTLILGPAEQGLETTKETATRQKFNLIKDNAKKLYGLVSQLLDFSKVESGTMKLIVAKGEIVGFLRRIVMSFESWAERKKIALEFTSDTDSTEGFFDADKLEKIMNNLLSNALKFTPEGGSTNVNVRFTNINKAVIPTRSLSESILSQQNSDADQKHVSMTPVFLNNGGINVVISVADTGPGIPAEHLPNIFNRFYRADNSHTVEGTGIGLALVWELTQLHHGTITVESSMGKGATFTVTIPIEKSSYLQEEIVNVPTEQERTVFVEPASVHQPSSTDITANGRPIVLIVEDNADLRAYIREFLDVDYVVYEASDGKAGLEHATETIPDIVISDVMMPEMDGIALCRALKQDVRTSHIPVILLTARAGTDSKVEGLEIGADDYVTKPFDSKELLARVKNLIEQRRQLRKKFSAGVVLKPGEVAVTSLDDSLLKKVMEVVEKNLGDENFSVEELAREACLSQRHLARKLQALTNLKPSEFIQYVRLQRSRELLEKNAGSIADIAYKVGFGSPSYFSSCFRDRFGYSPSDIPRKNDKL